MGKDRDGRFHPPKGRPSRTMREGPEMKDMKGSDVHIKRPNRQTYKGKNEVYKLPEEGTDRTWKERTYTNDVVKTAPEELYGVLTKEKLKELAEFRSEYCITIVLPTNRAGMEVNESHDLRLYKNIIQDLKLQKDRKDINKLKIERILEPAFELMRDEKFWKNQGEGIAIFIAEGYFWYTRLPFKPEQEVVVNNAFYLINLLRLVNSNSIDQFYVLLLRRSTAKLYKADALGMRELPVKDMPPDITAVIDFAEGAENVKEATAAETEQKISAGRPDKLIVGMYVEKISAAFQQLMDDTHWPLLLAGDKELIEAFRKVTPYENIFQSEMTTVDEHTDNRKIFQEAKEIIEESWMQLAQDRLDTYYNSIATPLTSSMPEGVIPAAFYGQARYLFVERGMHIWGSFNAQDNQLIMHAIPEAGDDCLIERAAVQTVLHGGEVFVLEKDKMPNGATIAALMRY